MSFAARAKDDYRQKLLIGALLLGRAVHSQAQPALEDAGRAILERNCITCHGATRASGLDMRTREGLVAGGARGTAVVPGNASQSLIYKAASGTGNLRMPPGGKGKLSDEDLETLRRWIDAGLGWGSSSEATAEPSWWSFRKLARPPVPTVADEAWGRNPIDAFVLAKLEEKGLRPVAGAGRRTLIRRA
jgi:mono/diheme cytochrome c family protein